MLETNSTIKECITERSCFLFCSAYTRDLDHQIKALTRILYVVKLKSNEEDDPGMSQI